MTGSLAFVSYFFGGLSLANAVPHFVCGTMGRPFQTPFAKPSGKGLSSSTANVCWGTANGVAGYILLFKMGNFDLKSPLDTAVCGLGALLIALFNARHFGRFHGGNLLSEHE